MSEDALQRVVDFVGDAGDELAERGELLRLRQTLAERLPLGLEPGLSRHVPGHEHGADRLAVLVDERRHRHDEAAAEARMLERAHALGGEVGVRCRGPLGEVGAHELGERALQELGARPAEAHREGVVHLHDPVLAIGDDHQVEERVERVFEQTPLPEHLFEQLDVLDAVRELTPEIAGQVEPLEGVGFVRPRALDDERAEGAAPAAQGRDEDRFVRLVLPLVRRDAQDLWPVEAKASRCGCVWIVGRDPLTRIAIRRVGRGDRSGATGPGGRAARPRRGARRRAG